MANLVYKWPNLAKANLVTNLTKPSLDLDKIWARLDTIIKQNWLLTFGGLVEHHIDFTQKFLLGKKIAHVLEEKIHWSIVFDEV